jgi:hypothetical protein
MEKIDVELAKSRWELRHVDEHLADAQDANTDPDPAVMKILSQIADWTNPDR